MAPPSTSSARSMSRPRLSSPRRMPRCRTATGTAADVEHPLPVHRRPSSACGRDRRVAELVLDNGERLAVLRARRRREVGLRQERVDRRGEVDPCYGGEAERWPAAGGCHERCSTARFPRSPGPAPGDFAGNVSSSRTSNAARRRSRPAPRRDPSGSAGRLRGEWGLPCGKRGTVVVARTSSYRGRGVVMRRAVRR